VSSPTLLPSSALPGQCWSNNTTSGKPATAATSYESSMLELKTMNTQIEPAEEVNILPELVSASAQITDPTR